MIPHPSSYLLKLLSLFIGPAAELAANTDAVVKLLTRRLKLFRKAGITSAKFIRFLVLCLLLYDKVEGIEHPMRVGCRLRHGFLFRLKLFSSLIDNGAMSE